MRGPTVAIVTIPCEEIATVDVTWELSAKDLQELGVEDVSQLEEKIRNREIDMWDLPADVYETIDSELTETYQADADVRLLNWEMTDD